MQANYFDGDGKWHSEYMKLCKSRTMDELIHVKEDCKRAIDAMPDNPKAGQYADEIHYCNMELSSRMMSVKSYYKLRDRYAK
mgnify:CR=1 FL=1